MSNAEDITNLFRRFGGDAGTYREIVEHTQVEVAQQSWPMLGQILPQMHHEAPPSCPGVVASAVRQIQPEEPVRVVASPPVKAMPSPVVTRPEPMSSPAHVAEPAFEQVIREPVQVPPMRIASPLAASPLVAQTDFLHVPPAKRVPMPASVLPEPAVAPLADAAVDAQFASQQAASQHNELQHMFARMSHAADVAEADPVRSPLKRLIKW